MRPFAYERALDIATTAHAGLPTGQGQTDATVQFLAGGTTLIDLMKLDVLRPTRVVDITPMADAHSEIIVTPTGLRLGALAKMSAVADDKAVAATYPMIVESLAQAASPQLRNMATLGGNVLQRTRCPYFRDPSWAACNKRSPGSGCAAMDGISRNHAVLGVDDSCIAQYPGDFAVALVALGAEVELLGPGGARVIAFESLHRSAGGQPQIENTLQPGEVIVAFRIPAGAWTHHSLYLKVRDRASYEFALSSAAVAINLTDGVVSDVRIGLGGVAYRPWRAHEAEAVLVGQPLTEATAQAAATAALNGAKVRAHNAYKPELSRRTLVRALLQAGAMET